MYPFMHGAKQVPKFIRLRFHQHWNHTWIHGSKEVAKCVCRRFNLYWNPNWIQGGCKMYPSVVPLALEPELDPRRFQKGIHRLFHCHWNHTWDPCIQVLCTMYPQQLNRQWSHFWLHESKDIINSTHTFCIGNGNNLDTCIQSGSNMYLSAVPSPLEPQLDPWILLSHKVQKYMNLTPVTQIFI